ncbi:ABC transporter permease [Chelativorans sp. M5D2P16]|uniref:ABC transporter permease n=1 Tax=Chelativorans sp. M5D2P16 TaxID=3095678 RepID=UPI002ACA6FFC|nr:ABC transporter permease [Chelativorans sp. M5D2P16]MDZ5699077.1 ABC transporter permease [Chelativorans sp. M5D2P16]
MNERINSVETAPSRATLSLDRLRTAPFLNVAVAIVVIYVILTAITGETFNTVNNQITIMRAASVFLILAVGQTLVMTTGGIDISTGSMIGVVGAIVGSGLETGMLDPVLAILVAIVIGAALGAFNGFNITVLGVPPLLATLGTFVAYRGFTQYYMGVNLVTDLPNIVTAVGRAWVLGLPLAVWVALLVTLAGWFVLQRTLYGRYITAIGSNPKAAEATRINVRAITASTYVIQGGLAGLAALVLMGRLNSASAAMGEGIELHVIAAVVLGGTYLFGGRSTMIGTLLGVYVIGMLENGLIQTGAGFFVQRMILGLLIIAAVALQLQQRRSGPV